MYDRVEDKQQAQQQQKLFPRKDTCFKGIVPSAELLPAVVKVL